MRSTKPTCHLCKKKTDEEQFCFGCECYVCKRCDINFCMGQHAPVDHVRQLPGEFHGS